jgi:putative acetyltransferase
MIVIRQVTQAHGPESELIRQVVDVFCAARVAKLQFLMDLHSGEEDRRFFSSVVLPTKQAWVAEADGRVVGFIAFAEGWVNHLYVTPEFQGQGIGKRLMAIAKESNPSLQLWVFESNEPAIAFYERQGFRTVERTDGSTNETGMPDLRMEWRA